MTPPEFSPPELPPEFWELEDDDEIIAFLRKFSKNPKSRSWIRTVHPSVLNRIMKEDMKSALLILGLLQAYCLPFYEQKMNALRAKISDAAEMELIYNLLCCHPRIKTVWLKITNGAVGRPRREFNVVRFQVLEEFHLYDPLSEFNMQGFLQAVTSKQLRIVDVCGTFLTDEFANAVASVTSKLEALKIGYRHWGLPVTGKKHKKSRLDGISKIIAQLPSTKLRTLHLLLPLHVAQSKEESSRLLHSLKSKAITVNNLVIEVVEEIPDTNLIAEICSRFNLENFCYLTKCNPLSPSAMEDIRKKCPGAVIKGHVGKCNNKQVEWYRDVPGGSPSPTRRSTVGLRAHGLTPL